MDLSKHIGKGIWALLDKSLTGVYGLAVVFLLIGKLPRTEYGAYATAFAIVNIGLLFNKGFILFPMTKFEAEGKQRPQLLGSTFLLSLFSVTAFGISIYLLAPLIADIFNRPVLEKLLKMTPFILWSFFFRDFSVSYLVAHKRVKLLTLLDAVYFLSVAGGFAVLNIMGKFTEAIVPVYVHLISAALCSLIGLIILVRELKMIFRPTLSDIRKISGFGKYSLSMSIGEMTFYQFDLLLLGFLVNTEAVAVYHAAKQPFRFYSLLTQSINLLVFPGASQLHAQNRVEDIRIMYEKIIAYYLTAMVAFNLLLFLGADFLLSIFYGGKYPDSLWIFRIFLIFSFFEPLYNLTMGVLYGLGKPEKAFRPLLTGVPLFLLGNLILMTLFSGIGAAITFGMTNLFMALRMLSGLKKEIGISYLDSLVRVKNIPGLVVPLLKMIYSKKDK